jgi:hypothetical protein
MEYIPPSSSTHFPLLRLSPSTQPSLWTYLSHAAHGLSHAHRPVRRCHGVEEDRGAEVGGDVGGQVTGGGIVKGLGQGAGGKGGTLGVHTTVGLQGQGEERKGGG